MTVPLDARRKVFVDQYLIDLNATAAARRAGYGNTDGSYSTQGARLLADVDVQAEIRLRLAARRERTGITQDKVVRELARIAFASMGDFAEWSPAGVVLKASAELHADDLAAVGELSESPNKYGRSLRIKLHDKLSALDKLGKHLGMWRESVSLDVFLSSLPEELRTELGSALAEEIPGDGDSPVVVEEPWSADSEVREVFE